MIASRLIRKKYNQKAYIKRKDKKRNVFLMHKFKITLEEYNKMLEQQDQKCKICKNPEKHVGRVLCVDHCHRTGKIRGLLCNHCNTGIGMFQDKVEYLLNAINYLNNNDNGSNNANQ